MEDQASGIELVTKIILNSSDHAQTFKFENLVYRSQFITTIKHISAALKLAKDTPEGKNLHNTITLFGPRGSGKTSFLLSVKNSVEKNETDGDNLTSIQVLDIIDPTLIEEKGHVFLNVISLIADLVEKKFDQEECNSSHDKMPIVTRKAWRSSLNKLAAGLPSIDGIGSHNSDSWQDPEFVMDNGLKAVAASQKLSQNFNEFLKHSLNALQKEAFMLMFDDIDVDATKGWVVLETIRKYFTGSRLITLISGDLELYTTVVRQKKWQNFGREILKYEGTHAGIEGGLGEFRRLVTTLTAQYMLKIMQPKYRIYLNTLLHRKITRGKLDISIAFDDKGKEEDLGLLYKNILESYGIVNKVEFEAFTTFLLSQPLRSQIQFLFLFAFRDNKIPVDNNALLDVFLSNLLEHKIDIAIAANNPKYLISVILNLLLEKQNLEDLYQLQPTTTDESLNATLYSLSLLLSNTIKNNYRFIVFDFIIKIGYLRNLMTILPYRGSNSEDKLRPSIEDLCSRTGVLHDGILRDVTGKILAYLYGALELEGTVNDITPFFIRLRALKSISRQAYTDRIDVVFAQENVGKAARILGYIPCFSGTFGYKNESRIAYSFYLLLAAIGEIVKEYETILTDETEIEARLVKQLLKELSQLRSYPIIGFAKRQSEVITRGLDDQPDNLRNQDFSNDRSDDELALAILQWLKSNRSMAVASHLLGKITTRFFYAMKNVVEANSQNITLDELFHRQVIAFMNAVLIEDIRESIGGQSPRLNINNTNTDDSILINNLRSIMDPRRLNGYHELSFSRWMLGCPLLLAYLRIGKNSELQNLLHRYSTAATTEIVKNFNVSGLLKEVAIGSKGEYDQENPSVVSQGSPQLLRNPVALVRLLQENNIPYEWFIEGEDRSETLSRNNLIRQYIPTVFLNDNRTAGRIRNFRRDLLNEGITW